MSVKGWGEDMDYPDYFDIPFDHKNHTAGDYPECVRALETFLFWIRMNKERLFPELEVLGEELKRRYSQSDIG